MIDRARTLVIGLGNPLMRDDGIGLAALERLRTEWQIPDDIELVDGGTWGMYLLPLLEHAAEVILLDAIRTGAAPGTVVELRREELPLGLSHKLSPHQIDLREILAILALRDAMPEDLVAVGIEPALVEMGTELSESVLASLPVMMDRVAAQLEARGHRCRRADAREAAPCTN